MNEKIDKLLNSVSPEDIALGIYLCFKKLPPQEFYNYIQKRPNNIALSKKSPRFEIYVPGYYIYCGFDEFRICEDNYSKSPYPSSLQQFNFR